MADRIFSIPEIDKSQNNIPSDVISQIEKYNKDNNITSPEPTSSQPVTSTLPETTTLEFGKWYNQDNRTPEQIEADRKAQEAEFNRLQEVERQKQLDAYYASPEYKKYIADKTAYDEYVRQKAIYDQAQHIYFKRQSGQNVPLDSKSEVDRLVAEWERKKEITNFYNQERSKPAEPGFYFRGGTPYVPPTAPEGYQGVSDPNVPGGVYYEPIPTSDVSSTKTSVYTLPPSVINPPTNQLIQDFNNSPKNQFNYSLPGDINLRQPSGGTIQNMQPQFNFYSEPQKPMSSISAYDSSVKNTNLPFYESVPLYFSNQWEKSVSKQNYLSAGVVFGGSFAYGFSKAIVYDIPVGVVKIVPEFLSKPGEVIEGMTFGTYKQISQGLSKNPGETTGMITAQFLAPKVYSKATILTKETYLKAGSKFVEPELVFAKEVLIEKNDFPTSSSVKESISRFESTRKDDFLYGQHSTTAIFQKETFTSSGNRAKLGLEGTGLNITPKGQGSPFFLEIPKEPINKFTLNPVEIIKKTVNDFKQSPNVVEVRFKDISRLPEEVLNTPGFEASNEFLKSQQGSGKAFITKRSELGLGEIPKQEYFRNKVLDKTSGNIIEVKPFKQIEQGTTEIEAAVYGDLSRQKSSSFMGKIKGFEEYTIYNDRVVPIRKYSLVEESSTLSRKTSGNIFKEIKSYAEYNSKYLEEGNIKYKTPYSKLPFAYALKESYSLKSNSYSEPSYSKVQETSYKVSGYNEPVYSSYSEPIKISYSSSSNSYPEYLTTPSYKTSSVPTYPDVPEYKVPSYTNPDNSSYPSLNIPDYPSTPTKTYYSSSYPITTRSSSKFSPGITSERNSPINYIPLKDNKSKKKSKKKSRLYVAQVRRKGKWESVSEPTSKGQAASRGEYNVENTLARSFRLVKTNQFAEIDSDYFNVDRKKFRNPFPRSRLQNEGSEIYIQRNLSKREGGVARGLLTSYGERRELSNARRKSNIQEVMNF